MSASSGEAAEQNFAASQSVLASYYSTGDGVPVDYVEAYAWHNLADEGGDRFAGKFRNDLEKKMSPQQVAAAEKRTKELRSQIAARLKSRGK